MKSEHTIKNIANPCLFITSNSIGGFPKIVAPLADSLLLFSATTTSRPILGIPPTLWFFAFTEAFVESAKIHISKTKKYESKKEVLNAVTQSMYDRLTWQIETKSIPFWPNEISEDAPFSLKYLLQDPISLLGQLTRGAPRNPTRG